MNCDVVVRASAPLRLHCCCPSAQTVAAVRAWCKGSYCWVVRGNWDDEALEAYRSLARGQATWEDLNPKFQFVQELLPEVRSKLCPALWLQDTV